MKMPLDREAAAGRSCSAAPIAAEAMGSPPALNRRCRPPKAPSRCFHGAAVDHGEGPQGPRRHQLGLTRQPPREARGHASRAAGSAARPRASSPRRWRPGPSPIPAPGRAPSGRSPTSARRSASMLRGARRPPSPSTAPPSARRRWNRSTTTTKSTRPCSWIARPGRPSWRRCSSSASRCRRRSRPRPGLPPPERRPRAGAGRRRRRALTWRPLQPPAGTDGERPFPEDGTPSRSIESFMIPAPPPPSRMPQLVALAVAVFIAVGGFVMWWQLRVDGPRISSPASAPREPSTAAPSRGVYAPHPATSHHADHRSTQPARPSPPRRLPRRPWCRPSRPCSAAAASPSARGRCLAARVRRRWQRLRPRGQPRRCPPRLRLPAEPAKPPEDMPNPYR